MAGNRKGNNYQLETNKVFCFDNLIENCAAQNFCKSTIICERC